jgi:uncharacterized cupin superfamily protein
MSVYPDSDKVSGPEGILLRSSAVGYWHNEGTAGQVPAEIVSEPETPAPQAAVHALDAKKVGPLLSGERLDATVVHLEPGEGSEPYHYVHGREAWLLVLAGTLILRHPRGEDRVEAGDLVYLPDGPAGARRLRNRGESAARALILSTTGLPANVCYPDTGEWRMQNEPTPR